jgi:serine/threonine protein kinase
MDQDDGEMQGRLSYTNSDVYISPAVPFASGSSSGTEESENLEGAVSVEDLFDGALESLKLDPKGLHIHSNLGQGYFADTYQATYTTPDDISMEVAVKRIVLSSFRQQSEVALFVKEVAIWSKLSHPHLVQLLGYIANGAERYSVMELLGPSLHDALTQERQGKLEIPLESKIAYAQHVASALTYMHTYNPPVLHRDLTPSNVLLTCDLQLAKVGDFGLAREALSEGMTMTSAVGNCVCMAPEVFNGGKYHSSADVYSYGMLLYQLFVNPADICQGYSPQVWASLASQDRRRPPVEPLLELGIPALAELIQACWQQEPRARPSFRDIVDYLPTIFG